MMNAMLCSYVGKSANFSKNSMIFRDFFVTLQSIFK